MRSGQTGEMFQCQEVSHISRWQSRAKNSHSSNTYDPLYSLHIFTDNTNKYNLISELQHCECLRLGARKTTASTCGVATSSNLPPCWCWWSEAFSSGSLVFSLSVQPVSPFSSSNATLESCYRFGLSFSCSRTLIFLSLLFFYWICCFEVLVSLRRRLVSLLIRIYSVICHPRIIFVSHSIHNFLALHSHIWTLFLVLPQSHLQSHI